MSRLPRLAKGRIEPFVTVIVPPGPLKRLFRAKGKRQLRPAQQTFAKGQPSRPLV
ncbi:MAG: hypothetical protein ACK5JR_09850 [Tropicimonas sp.]|uniref:hypothetical protein n=1 Tax=Tropicimonas sp. TaxID=2067044 RepID=UPI003A877CAB